MMRALCVAMTVWSLAAIAGQSSTSNPCLEFDRLYAQIRDQQIDHTSARARVRSLLPRIDAYFQDHRATPTPPERWRFPLEGYGAEAIGGTNGSGYVATGYDYFDGYKSRGHPGHDLFIHDRNRDELDDKTGKPVAVFSISTGVVVATAADWPSDSLLRGGRYVYVYDPAARGMFYYAHNRAVLVSPGEIVTAGQTIAYVGRSGRNASAPRSPTHLHVMFLAIDEEGDPKPRDIYQDLVRLGRRPGAHPHAF
ncbi:MAG TPA: M23 family metallopeptidase [Vicinamibacterales bacterium]|jgi:murein DD-endopeptidase MepM/ murein hydrolase activator NlpD